jgi:MFS family permease
VADLFRPERRPLAYSIFGSALSISSILFFPVIGWIGQSHGWRSMFVAAGVPGILLALFFLVTVKEPRRGASDARRSESPVRESLGTSLAFLARSRTYLCVVAGATFMGLNIFAASVWTPTFLTRVHSLSLIEVATVTGPVRGAFGLAGVLLGGLAIDRLGRRASHWRLTLPATACLLTAPVELAFLLAGSPSIWLPAYALSAFLVLVHQGPIFAAVVGIARIRMRAVATSVLLLFSALVGQALGPFVVGFLNDRLAAQFGDFAIRYSMLVIVLTALLAGLAFLLAARFIDEDLERARRSEADNAR